MALTRDEYMQILERISETGGFTEAMLDDLQKLKDDYDEREGMLRVEDEASDKTVYTDDQVYDTDGVSWRDKYDDMKRRYKARFFSTPLEAKEEQIEDIASDSDSTTRTYEEIFETREGDYNAD